jgi:membrane-associated phospholipid phosphatase
VSIAEAELDLFRALRVAPSAERSLKVFSKAGEHAGAWLALGLAGAALDERRRDEWLRATAVVGVAYVTNIALKYVVRRKRPEVAGFPALTNTVTTLSFPSAHSTTAFAAARVFSSLLPPWATGPLYTAATAMAVSRIALGVHYPSDVIAGAVLGSAIGEAALR